MLVRSAGRRRQRHTSQLLAASFAQLNLPWLAPAQLRWSASQASLPADAPPRRRRPSLSGLGRAKGQARQLATATDQYAPSPSSAYPPPGYSPRFKNGADENVPWDFSQRPHRSIDTEPRFSSIRPYNDPIIINNTLQRPSSLIKVQHGVHGTATELLQHLHTTLRIGRLNRAEAIILRLAEQSPPWSPELLHAHTVYLEEHLRMLASQSKGTALARKTLKDMQSWFEVEVRKKAVQPDARLLVVMTRAAIIGMDGKARDRAVRRYADWAETLGSEVQEEVLYSEDYDDNEFTILGQATSQFYEEEPEGERAPIFEEPEAQRASEAKVKSLPERGNLDLDTVPEVMPTGQKGTSLANIKRAMQTFVDLPPLASDAPLGAQRERAYERQRLMEEKSVDIAIDRWRSADEDLRKIGIHTAMQSRPIGALMWQWYRELLPALEKELAEVKELLNQPDKKYDDERYHYGPYLELLPPQKMAANTILFVMSKMADGKSHDNDQFESEAKLNQLTTGLGKQLEAECSAEASMKRPKGDKQARSRGARRARKALLSKLKHKGVSALTEEERSKLSQHDLLATVSWPLAPKVKLGAMLIQKLIENAHLPVTREHPRTRERITQMQPAFLHRVKYVLGKKIGVLVPNPALVEKLQSEPMGSLIAKRMPMIVEPKPWTGWSKGGYMHYPNPIMRLAAGDKSGKDYFLAADNNGDMGQVYAGLTALSKVPWRVHPGVLKVQIEAWNSGEEIANFAPLHPQFNVPPEPEAGMDPTPRRQWLLQLREIENRKAGLHSKRCFQNFQLEIARAVANETLYFPHNMDFRGRAYPIPPYLNHMGADNVRGLLVFAEGKPLGETGLRWLKIHTATVAGFDKASMEERLKFTEKHLDDIYDSVRNPLGGRRWWLQAEDAWQTLAACFELTAALDTPDPTKFVSTLPIQQDGTCNGLQHYAALGGDEIGARQVNLEPGDRPADVYTAVAEAVKEEVRKEAEQGNPIAQRLHGRITRKCVKQPVMTNVYGVTFFGAKEQVLRQLEVLFPEVDNRLTLRIMSHYIATKIFKSLGSMFRGAQEIQNWLGQCADRVATCLTPQQIKQLTSAENLRSESRPKKGRRQAASSGSGHSTKVKNAKKQAVETGDLIASTGTESSERVAHQAATPLFKSTVVWTTPLRLPVVQPYRKTGSKEIKTNLQNIHLQEPQVWDPVSKRKQLQAFPPNFIHSLDATHMLLSALKCNEEGLTFASIHDSFWTHACDVNTLSTVLRDAFVEMHSEDIIGRLREEFETRYKGCMYMASVLAKSKVGKKITEWRKSMKATSAGKSSELALEARRMRLLKSEDPEERREGEAMVTPGSIMSSEGDESAFAAPSELVGQTLGDMPANADVDAAHAESDSIASVLEAEEPEGESPERHAGGPLLDTDTPAVPGAGSSTTGPKGNADVEEAFLNAVAASGAKARRKAGTGSKVKKQPPRKIYVWLPMEFPEVPAKGGFDVRRLRASKYFFH